MVAISGGAPYLATMRTGSGCTVLPKEKRCDGLSKGESEVGRRWRTERIGKCSFGRYARVGPARLV